MDHVIKALIFIDARVGVRGNDVAMGRPSAHLPGSGIRSPSPASHQELVYLQASSCSCSKAISGKLVPEAQWPQDFQGHASVGKAVQEIATIEAHLLKLAFCCRNCMHVLEVIGSSKSATGQL